MVKATGTLEWLNEFVSDTPNDIDVVYLRATIIVNALSEIASGLNARFEQTPRLVLDKKSEEETLTVVNALGRELERLLEIKRQLEAKQR